MSEQFIQKDEKTGRFVQGNIGGGRPKGSRNKLGEEFVEGLQQTYAKYGVAALEKLAVEEPAVFINVIAKVIPKELIVKSETVDEMSDDELIDILATIRSLASAGSAKAARKRTGSETDEGSPRGQPH